MTVMKLDETSPLLPNQPVEDPGAIRVKVTPLPKLQLGVVTCIRLVEPIAYTQIFPYINEFLSDLHVTDDPKRIGFYSGLVESTFAVFQLVSIYNFAKLSDKIGRRPVILCGVAGVGLGTLVFGLSGSLHMMLVIRAVTGLCSGNSAVMHSAVGELTDSSNFGIALPIFGLSWPLGTIVGPLLGGSLSHPAQRFRWLDFDFLRDHPYFLPGFTSSALTSIAVLVGYFVLEETLPSKRLARQQSITSLQQSTTSLYTDISPRHSEQLGVKALLASPAMFALCWSGFALSFLAAGFEVIFVLYSYTAVQNGGLGFPAKLIGYSLSISGVTSVLLQLLLMPYLLRTFNKAKMYNMCLWMYPGIFPIMSTLNIIARSGFDEATGAISSRATAAVWAGIVLILVMSRIANLAFALSMVLIKENCPNPASLGMSNGLTQFTMCLARAVSPAFVSSIYALSVDYNILGGFAWVPAMIFISLCGVYQSSTIARASI